MNYTTKTIIKMNLSGNVTKAFNSIALGPIAKISMQNAQQKRLEKNNDIEKEAGSPVL
jgi:hypothetical protein